MIWQPIDEFDGGDDVDYLVVYEGVIFIAWAHNGVWLTDHKPIKMPRGTQTIEPKWFMEIPEIPGSQVGSLVTQLRTVMDMMEVIVRKIEDGETEA